MLVNVALNEGIVREGERVPIKIRNGRRQTPYVQRVHAAKPNVANRHLSAMLLRSDGLIVTASPLN
jgi:hypothetical protein